MEQNLKEIVTDEISIERVTNIKYLGVIIDVKLNWNMHINFGVRLARKILWYF